jgi:hypothetical protein
MKIVYPSTHSTILALLARLGNHLKVLVSIPKIPGSTAQYCINGNTQMSSDLTPGAANDPMPCSSVVSRSVPLQMNTNNDKGLTDIELYPNPANLQLIIESPFEQTIGFYVFNMQGKMAINGFAFKGKNFVNIEQLPSGLYIFRFQNGDTKKIEILK